ncbi:MAG TPA: hypothetical protein VNF73_12910 [Candidatus Saccharimonadales bacterium]|nr:hypothetical protein [Candidatus Saccharimonadales bacterium]
MGDKPSETDARAGVAASDGQTTPPNRVRPKSRIEDLAGQEPLIRVDPDEATDRPTPEGKVLLEVENERMLNG